jgi:hypothetical protein
MTTMPLRAFIRRAAAMGPAPLLVAALAGIILTDTIGVLAQTTTQGATVTLQPDTRRHVCALGLAVPVGAATPDLADDAALRRTLLAANTIAFTGDELSGAAFRDLIATLGIARQVEPKLIDTGNGDPLELVAEGRADLAVSSVGRVASANGIQALRPLILNPTQGPC